MHTLPSETPARKRCAVSARQAKVFCYAACPFYNPPPARPGFRRSQARRDPPIRCAGVGAPAGSPLFALEHQKVPRAGKHTVLCWTIQRLAHAATLMCTHLLRIASACARETNIGACGIHTCA